MKRVAVKAGLLTLAFFAIAAPGGGGGGGGTGGGGGGGGTSGGSYGGSSHSSWDNDSSYHRSYYYDRGGNDYDGLPPFLREWQTDLIVVGVILLAAGGLSLKDRFAAAHPYRLGNWGLLLRNADRYTRAFERIARERQFRTPADRQAAMREIVNSIDPADIVDSFFSHHGSDLNGEMLGPAAETMYTTLSQQAEIDKGVEHLQLPNMTIHQDDGANVLRPATSDSLCIFGLILVSNHIKGSGGHANSSELYESLRQSSLRHGPLSYMFFYYSPRPGESLAPAEAKRLFAKVSRQDDLQASEIFAVG